MENQGDNISYKANSANICKKCGTELREDELFCHKCGYKVASENDNINEIPDEKIKQSQKKPSKAIIISIIVLACAVLFKLAIPYIFPSVERLCEQGNYIKAYEKATEFDKPKVAVESIAAERSAYSAENLKDPTSFKLREVYYLDVAGVSFHLVLLINGANSYGANISSYWLYDWNKENNEWEYWGSVHDLSDDDWYTGFIRSTVEDGIKLDREAIKRINKLYEEERLDNIVPLKPNDSDSFDTYDFSK